MRTRKLTEIVQLGYNVTSIASYPTPFAVAHDRQAEGEREIEKE